ncbi:Pentatricopeptide repeat superfamily protein [Gossypium australe]|uniref:Pentatricopeptide repeat superfamily protein n=1 Tax=Gossypium australe TaxID=47621 RepID=A0A5B6VXT4_9ROSI|nr:Pentatricopeptide repeat superfamily protein [Gossypium australe]
MVFNEIERRGLNASVVSFNTFFNGYCKSVNIDEGFRLKVLWRNVLINGLCKESRLDNAKELFEEMFNKGLIPNDYF